MLEKILGPARKVDRKILEFHDYVAEGFGKLGIDRNRISTALNAGSFASMLSSVNFFPFKFDAAALYGATGMFLMSDFVGTLLKTYESEKDESDRISHSDLYYKIFEKLRMPSFIFGASSILNGVAHAADYLKTNSGESLQNALWDISYGFSFLATGSSLYFKSRDGGKQKQETEKSEPSTDTA